MTKSLFELFCEPSGPAPQNLLTRDTLHFVEHLPFGALLADAQGHIAFGNSRAGQLLNTAETAFEGGNIATFGLTVADVSSLLQATAGQKNIKELTNKNLQNLFVSVGASKLGDYTLITLESVPQQRRLEADKRFLVEVVNHYPMGVTMQNTQDVCCLWNRKAEEIFGRRGVNTLGQEIYKFLPPEMLNALELMDQEVKDSAKVRPDARMHFTDSNGQDRTLSVSKIPVLGADGAVSYILTSYEDITNRYTSEQEIMQTRNMLQAIVDNVPVGLYTRTADRRMMFFNKQSQIIFNEVQPRFANSPHAKQTREQIDAYHEREEEILRTGKIQEFPDEVYLDHAGNERYIHMIKVPLFKAGPEPVVLSIVEDVTKRREQEREIVRMNKLLQAIVDNAPIGLYARGKDGQLLLRNKRCTTMFGAMDDKDFSANGSLPHETKEDVASYLGRESEVLSTGKTLDLPEEPYKTPDGTQKILHLIKVPVKDETNELNFVITLAEDITEKKEQENRLAVAHNFQQAVLDNAPLAIYARGVDNQMSFINKAAHEIFPDETEYKEESDFYGQREKAIFADKKVVDLPAEWYTTRRGNKVLLHLIKAPVYDKDGNPYMMLTLAQDITKQKKQEEEVIKTRNFLQTVIDNLPLALSVKNQDGKYILWNKKSEALFGTTSAEVIGRSHYRHDISPEQAEFLSSADQKVFESGKELNIPQELISTATEGVKIMHTVKTPVFTQDGKPDCLLSVSEDITSKTKMEKQIREASDKNTLLVDNAREGVAMLEDGNVLYANHAILHILGLTTLEELQHRPLLDLVAPDHRIFAQEKYDAVANGTQENDAATEIHFLRPDGTEVETEFAATASRYLGRRIVMCFVRDVTASNRAIREIKKERENFRAAFENSITPAFVMTGKGYITVMNRAARELFNFTLADKNFYRNVYMKPAITLAARRELRQGHAAQMDYVFDFERAKVKFPDRIKGDGKLPLSVTFEPMNRRDSKDGTVEADYVVYLQPKDGPAPLPPTKGENGAKPRLRLVKKGGESNAPAAPHAPAAPVAVPPAPPVKIQFMLPNTEPYAVCSPEFKITQCNDLFCSLCQLEQGELTGQEISKLFDETSSILLKDDLKSLAAGEDLENREYNLRLASGLETVAVRLSAVKESNGSYLFILRNLAFHRQIMHILEERSAQLNALLDATEGVVFSVSCDGKTFGRIEQANKFLAQMLDYSHDELISLKFRALFSAPNRISDAKTDEWFAQLEEQFFKDGRANFSAPVYRKDGSKLQAEVTIVPIDLASRNEAMVVVRDVSTQLDKLAQDSQQAQELRSVRQAMPGLYLKVNAEGRVLEVSSNLEYLTTAQASERFMNKTPNEYWPEQTASQEMFAVKEALSVNITTHFDFTQEEGGRTRSYEAAVTPITGREEAIIWIKDVSEKQEHDGRVRELYEISQQTNLSITDLVDKILEFGKRVFKADIGLILRFADDTAQQMSVVYVTQNDFNVQRYMEFPVEECLTHVAEDSISQYPDLGNTSCTHCIHVAKQFGAMIAAPLSVNGKAAGALCFASRNTRRSFDAGAEELIGLMARILGLRIELRQAGKAVSETSQSLTRTLEYVDFPAVMIGMDYRIRSANAAFLETTGCRVAVKMNFFDRFIRKPSIALASFKSAAQNGNPKAFRLRMDLLHEDGLYVETNWEVFVIKDAEGQTEGYALIGTRNSK